MTITEDQWAALKKWIEGEASDRAGGMISRLGHTSWEEQAARVAFGLPNEPEGVAEAREKLRHDMSQSPQSPFASRGLGNAGLNWPWG
jgi:hypothetical protein